MREMYRLEHPVEFPNFEARELAKVDGSDTEVSDSESESESSSSDSESESA